MIKIGILGGLGRMGRVLCQGVVDSNEAHLSAVTVKESASQAGKPLSDFVPGMPDLPLLTDVQACFDVSDVVIDFTTAGSTETHCLMAVETNTPLIIGTSKFSDADDAAITQASQNVAIVQSMNMSLATNLMYSLVEKSAKALDASYDIEVFEMHHNQKLDAPSGTAIEMGRRAASGRGFTLPEPVSTNRDGLRKKGDIGFLVSRGGSVPADCSVTFAGQEEMFTLSTRSLDRSVFAQGAIKAAVWAVRQPAKRYTMRDMLGV